MTPAFILDIRELDSEGRDFSFPVVRSWLKAQLADTEYRFDDERSEGDLKAHIMRTQDELILRSTIRTGITTDCHRCAEDVFLPIYTEMTTLLLPRGREILIDPEDDLDYDTYSGDELILDGLVREYIVLAIPMQIHCEGGCEMPTIPESIRGKDEYWTKPKVDPRFASLMKLKEDLSKDQE